MVEPGCRLFAWLDEENVRQFGVSPPEDIEEVVEIRTERKCSECSIVSLENPREMFKFDALMLSGVTAVKLGVAIEAQSPNEIGTLLKIEPWRGNFDIGKRAMNAAYSGNCRPWSFAYIAKLQDDALESKLANARKLSEALAGVVTRDYLTSLLREWSDVYILSTENIDRRIAAMQMGVTDLGADRFCLIMGEAKRWLEELEDD